MSELDELVASPGVFMAGRFGLDGRVAELGAVIRGRDLGLLHEDDLSREFCGACGPAFPAAAPTVIPATLISSFRPGPVASSWPQRDPVQD
jgi:hypothetical protein